MRRNQLGNWAAYDNHRFHGTCSNLESIHTLTSIDNLQLHIWNIKTSKSCSVEHCLSDFHSYKVPLHQKWPNSLFTKWRVVRVISLKCPYQRMRSTSHRCCSCIGYLLRFRDIDKHWSSIKDGATYDGALSVSELSLFIYTVETLCLWLLYVNI